MKVILETYYFFANSNYHMRSLNINLLEARDGESRIWKKNYPTPLSRIKDSKKFSILSKNTLASSNTFLSTFNANQEWYREIKLPQNLLLMKDQFFLDINYEMEQSLDLNKSFLNTNNIGFVNIKSPEVESNFNRIQ